MGSRAEKPLGWAGQVQGGFQKEVGFVELFATLEVTRVGMMPQADRGVEGKSLGRSPEHPLHRGLWPSQSLLGERPGYPT